MIFCFSGTGNSLHVAECIASNTNDRIVMISKGESMKNKLYHISADERVGFVMPVYWWGIPKEVETFVQNLNMEFENQTDTCVYGVTSFGLVKNNGMNDLQNILKQKGITVQATFEVKMVDNYVVGYELAKDEKKEQILKEAQIVINDIVEKIVACEQVKIHDPLSKLKPVVHSFYKRANHEKKFYVTDHCVRCGKCERECPSNTITMKNNQLVWSNECSFCLKCIHSCPVEAIQYGKTQGRKRYTFSGMKLT